MIPRVMSGWLNLDKPCGISSNRALGPIKRLLRGQKVGHLGTLDPLATGILPIAVGHATKLIPYISSCDKEYVFEVTWGEARDTDDAEGQVVALSEKRPKREEIEEALSLFKGTILKHRPFTLPLKFRGKEPVTVCALGNLWN